MVSRRVMMAAATHSHSSRLSMRRKLPWGVIRLRESRLDLDCQETLWPAAR
jgi:hypothetical protein